MSLPVPDPPNVSIDRVLTIARLSKELSDMIREIRCSIQIDCEDYLNLLLVFIGLSETHSYAILYAKCCENSFYDEVKAYSENLICSIKTKIPEVFKSKWEQYKSVLETEIKREDTRAHYLKGILGILKIGTETFLGESKPDLMAAIIPYEEQVSTNLPWYARVWPEPVQRAFNELKAMEAPIQLAWNINKSATDLLKEILGLCEADTDSRKAVTDHLTQQLSSLNVQAIAEAREKYEREYFEYRAKLGDKLDPLPEEVVPKDLERFEEIKAKYLKAEESHREKQLIYDPLAREEDAEAEKRLEGDVEYQEAKRLIGEADERAFLRLREDRAALENDHQELCECCSKIEKSVDQLSQTVVVSDRTCQTEMERLGVIGSTLATHFSLMDQSLTAMGSPRDSLPETSENPFDLLYRRITADLTRLAILTGKYETREKEQ
jgi:hypothetical protein